MMATHHDPQARSGIAADPRRGRGAELMARIGAASSAVGTETFHQSLLDLLNAVVPGDRRMVVRYFQAMPPEIFGCVGVPQALVDLYLSGHYAFDPFLHHWRKTRHRDVVVLRDVVAPDLARAAYMSVFIVKAGYRDELGVFLPWVGRSCIALFLERLHRRVSAAELERVRAIRPVLMGLNRAHLSRQLCALMGETRNLVGLGKDRGLLILDAKGVRVHANAAWLAFADKLPGIDRDVAALSTSLIGTRRLRPGHLVHIEPLAPELPLAPGGRAITIEAVEPTTRRDDPVSFVAGIYGDMLTSRELDVASLVLAGNPARRIASRLGIGVGAVRNHKSRIYAKLDITTERELFLDFCGHILTDRSRRPLSDAGSGMRRAMTPVMGNGVA